MELIPRNVCENSPTGKYNYAYHNWDKFPITYIKIEMETSAHCLLYTVAPHILIGVYLMSIQ